VLNGKKVKLRFVPPVHIHSSNQSLPIIIPGDYQIRLIKDETETGSGTINQLYELLLPNGDIWEGNIIGISE
jgi:hypothetical protein